MERPTPRAVCAVVIDDFAYRQLDGEIKILAVTRPNRPDQIALPGGKIEFAETPEEAVIRELKEETNVEGFRPVFLYTAKTRDGYGYCECFYIPSWVAINGLYSPEPVGPHWSTASGILNGPFATYNTEVLRILRERNLI